MVELADTLVLGTSARAWGFKSLQAHHNKRGYTTCILSCYMYRKKGLEPERATARRKSPVDSEAAVCSSEL